MPNISLEIITPTRTLYSGEVSMVRAPGSLGLFQVLPGHHPMISTLEIGRIDFREPDGEERIAATSDGYVEVLDNTVTVLASTAEFADEIDIDRAKEALERAKERLHETVTEELPADERVSEQAKLERAMLRALNRLRIARGKGG